MLLYANRGSSLVLESWKRRVGETVPSEWLKVILEALNSRRDQHVEIRIGIKTILLHVVPINDRGYVNLYGMDLTARRNAEEKLRLYAEGFESSAEAIVITDTELRILAVNRAFGVITGHTEEEVLGEQLSLHSGTEEK